MVAEIIIDSKVKTLNRIFDYEIPSDLEINIGSRVFVPFGNKKTPEEGIVIGIKEKSEYKVKKIVSVEEEKIDKTYIELAKWMSKRYICNLADSLRLMLPPGTTKKDVSKRVKTKTINLITLSKDEEEILDDIESKKIKSEKQKDVLEFIINNGTSSIDDIELFTDASKAVVSTLIKNGYLEYQEKTVERNPFIHKVDKKTSDLKLTDEQKETLESIKESGKYLIYGITGSGKTEIYMQLIERMLKENKSSIMLVPEISLTPQTVDRFLERFGEEKIAVLHSKLRAISELISGTK